MSPPLQSGLGMPTIARELKSASSLGGKIVTAWALEQDFAPSALKSNTFVLEWPPKSAKMREFPDVDVGAWFSLPIAHEKML
jgi:predicted NUDIX family NTP pyrophosphohydrolase